MRPHRGRTKPRIIHLFIPYQQLGVCSIVWKRTGRAYYLLKIFFKSCYDVCY